MRIYNNFKAICFSSVLFFSLLGLSSCANIAKRREEFLSMYNKAKKDEINKESEQRESDLKQAKELCLSLGYKPRTRLIYNCVENEFQTLQYKDSINNCSDLYHRLKFKEYCYDMLKGMLIFKRRVLISRCIVKQINNCEKQAKEIYLSNKNNQGTKIYKHLYIHYYTHTYNH